MGGITSAVAVHKGRSAVGWFFVGFLTGCIGLIIISCLPNQKEQSELMSHMETETRRLREQLKHEQLRNESFQTHMRHRIDAHDNALGVDTRRIGPGPATATPILPGPASPPAAGPTPITPRPGGPTPIRQARPIVPRPSAAPSGRSAPSPQSFTDCQWFVKFGTRKSQPLTFDKLKKFWEIGNLTPDTLVCTGEQENWMPVQDVPGLLDHLNAPEFQT